MAETRFVSMFDIHYGKERLSGGHYKPIHNLKAITPIFKFMEDFKPNAFVFGGDQIDFGEISHWNKTKKLSTEGLKLIDSLDGFKRDILDEVDKRLPKKATKIFHIGNHTDWLFDLIDANPALEGVLDLDKALNLTKRGWKIIPLEGVSNIGKIHFIHGQQIKGGDNIAKQAVLAYDRNIRFGHHHTYQTYLRTSALDTKDMKTGVAVPCLCRRDLKYGEGAPNRWGNGFLWGTVYPNGNFHDQVSLITDGTFYANGKSYAAR